MIIIIVSGFILIAMTISQIRGPRRDNHRFRRRARLDYN